ncbi:MAG: nucleotidyltransferase family protein [Acidimicrobiales bacterium]|nr:nucleotidyltransferase family protein [Acidimicrobiales bacterium]
MATAPAWGFDLADTTRAVLAHGLTDDPARPLSTRPLTDGAWTALRAEVGHHRLDGLLVAAVADDALPATAAQRAEVAELEVELTRNRMWHEQRSADIVDHLAHGGVAVRLLKGPALGALDYPDPQMRPTRDLDLLVHGADIDATDRLLAAMGGVRLDPDPAPGYAATVGRGITVALPGGLEVDVHRTLVWGPLGVRVPPDELWERPRPFTYGRADHTTLSAEATLLHACAHLLVLGWRRALTLRDVAQVLVSPDLDPDRLVVLSRRWGSEALLAVGVLMAARELRLDPASVGPGGAAATVLGWAHGFVPRWRDRLWLRVERPDDPIGALEAVATYLELRTPAERAVLRRATLTPAPGTYPSPAARAARVARRTLDRLPRPGTRAAV